MKKVFSVVFLMIFLVGTFYFSTSETKAFSSASDYTLHNIATANIAPETSSFLIYDVELPDPTDTLITPSEITPADGSSLTIYGEDSFYVIDVNSNGIYDPTEPIFWDDMVGEDMMPTSNGAMEKPGAANVTLFDASDKVYFEDADADGLYTRGTPEVIWYDVGDTGVFDAGTDWVIVGGATPDCVTYNCIEVSTLSGANMLIYLDNPSSVNGVYDTQKGTAGSSEMIFYPAEEIGAGGNLTYNGFFLDPANIDGVNDAGGSWLPLTIDYAGYVDGSGFNLSKYEGEEFVDGNYLIYKEDPLPNGKLNAASLSRFDLYNLGTAVNSDFGYGESVSLASYVDDGDGIFEIGEDEYMSNFCGTMYNGEELNSWTFSSTCGSALEVTPTSNRRLFVAASLHSSAVLDKTIQISSGIFNFDEHGFDFDGEGGIFAGISAFDGPNDEALTNSGVITIGSPAPDAITNLTCQPSGQGGAVFLSWTIPEGIVSEGYGYTGQYVSGNSITWDGGNNVSYGTTWPTGTAGSSSQQLVTGLNPNTQYSFILHSLGESESESEDSNTVTCYAPSSLGSGTADITPPTSEITSTSNKKIVGRAKDTGGSSVQKVEISLDNGTNWTDMTIVSSDNTYSYFEYNYSNLAVGTYQIKTRAIDWIGNRETPGSATSLVVSSSTSTTTPVISTTTSTTQTTIQIQQNLLLVSLKTQLLNLLLQLLQQLQAQLKAITG